MYKAMIVEDEMLVRIGIRNIIDWQALEIELVEDAADGAKALEIYEREHPDIILTDIRMPEMDGLTLIRSIRQQDARCRLLILTCVEDFEIAQKAIGYNVSGYLLKLTMTFDEVRAMIRKAVDELKSMSAPVSHVRTADLDAVKERFLKDFLFYHTCSGVEFQEYIHSYELKLNPNRLVVGILSLISYQSMKEQYCDQKGELVRVSILNVLQEVIESSFSGEVFHDTGSDYILILNLPSENEGENDRLLECFTERTREIMKMYFDTSILLCFSSPRCGFDHLSEAYQEAAQVLRQHFYMSHPAPFLQPESVLQEELSHIMKELENDPILDVLLEEKEKSNYSEQIRKLENALPSPNEIQTLFANLAEFVTYSVCDRTGMNCLNELKIHLSALQSAQNLRGLAVHHRTYLEKLCEKVREATGYSLEISQAISYISEHYTADISLKTLADHVHLSANYLSNLFKKEVGQKFVDYINALRIEQAKKLLLTSSKRTLQISDETGFSDSAYFSKVFKKATGLSPAEYRRIHTGIEEGKS